MKCIAGLLFFATLTSTLPVEKDKKAFSLFSVLSFPNQECTTTLTPLTTGLCLAANECTAAGGEPHGNCASGFGVCCFIIVEVTGALITSNITYIQNVGYPNPIFDVVVPNVPAVQTILEFRLEGNTDICHTRLDFEDVVLQQPLAADTGNDNNGDCGGTNGDSLVVESPTATILGFENLCGTLTGHHIYIPNSVNLALGEPKNDAATITITIGEVAFARRRWKIKTSQIECNNPGRADEGCLQFFTGLGGRIQSFNNLETNPIMISNLLYSVCVRREEGFCGLNVAQTRNVAGATPDSFHLQNTAGASATAYTDANCNREFIGIPSTKVASSRYCGGLLAAENAGTMAGTIPSDILPFRITVATDDGTDGAAPPANHGRIANSGFDLTYSQTPC